MTILGIIGGTGVEHWADAELLDSSEVTTDFGAPSAPLVRYGVGSTEVIFLSRHGKGHDIAPHLVNYRANIRALHDAGVDTVIALNAVGIIGDLCELGGLGLPDQLIDYTYGRQGTFFDGQNGPLRHIDFTEPYCSELHAKLTATASSAGIALSGGGIYGAMQGPRLETRAEVDRLERDGIDYVGMTGAPEAALARELDLSYACLALVVNAAAGRSSVDIHQSLEQNMAAARNHAMELVRKFVNSLTD